MTQHAHPGISKGVRTAIPKSKSRMFLHSSVPQKNVDLAVGLRGTFFLLHQLKEREDGHDL